MHPRDLESFRLSTPEREIASLDNREWTKPKRRRHPFLKGPISLAWLCKAAQLPGKFPLVVGLALYHLAGLRKSQDELVLSSKRLEPFGVKRRTTYDALAKLEEAGLVSVLRRPGCCPRVTILDVEEERP